MKNKLIELTDEELKFINERRAKQTLAAKFNQAVIDARLEISKQLRTADDAIQLAIEASEKYGIPFEYNPFFDYNGRYTPASWLKWGNLPRDLIEDQKIQGGSCEGWEYWKSSSFDC